ncbi:LANO_0G13740g1_1 [Lachancea nothofagi CBS 11611]|uniref:Probable metalloreductase AIM14 n=1 Tax=Lachancea nothofagi CBS 11611 TaxID=1266666 RepID=A0A1G4KK33_9SACH|nr:LANO_0G13740g1_1 [Lachancea nothofagi CBS 11611]
MEALLPRHSDTHFANIPYGYYALLVSVGFVLSIIAARFVVHSRPKSNSRWDRIVSRRWYNASPLLGLFSLFIPLLVPFVHHYSFLSHLTVYLKRLGRLSYVLATLNLFLTLRPNLLLPRYVYLNLIPLHKWLSRSIFLLALLHGGGFLVWWGTNSETSVVDHAFRNIWNLLGVMILVLLTILVLVSVKPMRRFSYRNFYFIHSIASWVFVFATALHARPGVWAPYTVINAGLFVLHIISKTFFARAVELLPNDLDNQEPFGLSRIVLPRKAMPETFSPASHLRISQYSRLNPLYFMLPSHPYTVSTLPDDPYVELIVREHVGGFQLQTGLRYTIQNHYESVPEKCIQNATRVALVCGGSGISYALPIFKYFASGDRATQITYLKLIWLVRDKHDISVLNHLKPLTRHNIQFEIYVTGTLPQDDTDNSRPKAVTPDSGSASGHDVLEFELESLGDHLDQNGALLQPHDDGPISAGIASMIHLGKKLDWVTDLAQFVEEDSLESTWLVTCGPSGLNDAGKLYAYDNKINLESETYAL